MSCCKRLIPVLELTVDNLYIGGHMADGLPAGEATAICPRSAYAPALFRDLTWSALKSSISAPRFSSTWENLPAPTNDRWKQDLADTISS